MLVVSQHRPFRALLRRDLLHFFSEERLVAGQRGFPRRVSAACSEAEHRLFTRATWGSRASCAPERQTGTASGLPRRRPSALSGPSPEGAVAGGRGSAPTWRAQRAPRLASPQVSPAPPPQVNDRALRPGTLWLACGAANRLLLRQRVRLPSPRRHTPRAPAVGGWLARAAVTRARGFYGPQLEGKWLDRVSGGPGGGRLASPLLPPWRSSGAGTASTAPAAAAAAMCGPAPLSWAPGTWWETGAGGSRRRWGGGDWGCAQRACAGVSAVGRAGSGGRGAGSAHAPPVGPGLGGGS